MWWVSGFWGVEQTMPNKEYTVTLLWDDDASVWVATSDDIPGLVLEGGSADALIERVRFAAPGLMALNSLDCENSVLHFQFERYAGVFA